LADALDWRKLKINGIDVNCTPLQKVIWLEERLTTGFCGPLDASFFDNDRAPKIAFHGRIHPWLGSMYNEPSFNVLEIGSRSVCSDSLWKSHFPRCRYTGFDVLQGKNVNVVGDAHRLSDYFEPRSFDLVISFAVLEHLAMPWVVAEEISKVLKVGGIVAIETHFCFSEHELPWHFFQFNSNALEVLFNRNLGFETLDKGMDNPIVGRFAENACGDLRGAPVRNMYCHSSIISRKEREVSFEKSFPWIDILRDVVGDTMYPERGHG